MDRSDHASPASAFRVPAFQDELAHLSNFVERALLASKAERGGLAPTPVPTDLSALLDDLSESYRLLAEEREIPKSLPLAHHPGRPRPATATAPRLVAKRRPLHPIPDFLHLPAKRWDSRTGNHQRLRSLHHASAGLGLRLVRGICKASAFQLDLATTPNYFQVRVRFPQR